MVHPERYLLQQTVAKRIGRLFSLNNYPYVMSFLRPPPTPPKRYDFLPKEFKEDQFLDKGLPMQDVAEETTDGFMPDQAFSKYGRFRYHFNQYSARGLWHVGLFFIFGWGTIFYLAKRKFGKVVDKANERNKKVNDALKRQKAMDLAAEQERAKKILAERSLTL
ncbi:uncharacterized protein LOC125652336 [Ostrea edulis]|uniref:uncharacterized protein LOC125652336 n=1 Tax=Ostrea edulis TaxID=37623 RepID=UPI002095941F|nr:uncharacterized protein LOC125652336 [Ostrea edulis]